MNAGRVNSQLPASNFQPPKQIALGVGGWVLAVDTLKVAVTTMATVLFATTPVLACPVCFGAEESSLIDGARLGVAVLLAITLSVQVGFVAFFLYLRKRAKRAADLELEDEWVALQRGSTTL